jgi:erythromycin esterase-like protein
MTTGALDAIRRAALPLDAGDVAPIVRAAGDARFALIGEASHGTHEFYAMRAEVTRRLIVVRGVTAVVAEADWPDAWRVNRYVRGESSDADANAALLGFERFPAWMWRNTVVRDFVEWLRAFNATRAGDEKVGFYGMDLYSLSRSIAAVLGYLDSVDPEAAKRARFRYACFDHAGEDTQAYGYAAAFGLGRSCEREAVRQLVEMTERAGADARRDDDLFYAEQNARLVMNAEAYYRTMFAGRVASWNLRDRHMLETLQALDRHLSKDGRTPRFAVWAHNSHLGDARATEMGRSGEWNVGQLVRETWPGESALVGFSTHHGTVTAASDWGGERERKTVRPGLSGSYEALFHDAGLEAFVLTLRGDAALAKALAAQRLQRAIGVIYAPHTERASHYFDTVLPRQFDAIVHLDATRALVALDAVEAEVDEEAPETYPTAL